MNLSSFHLVILSPDTLVALPVPSLWHPVLVLAVAGICSCRVLQNTLEESVGELFAPVWAKLCDWHLYKCFGRWVLSFTACLGDEHHS